jgi:DNA-binding GntR family transcriptional regulator
MSETGSLPQSRTEYVLDRLRAELQAGTISPGEQLRQAAIAKRYGVSPTPVREALLMLAADGMIEYTSHRGATVRDVTPQMAQDLYRLRAEMEGLGCELAVERLDEAALAKVKAANDELKRAVLEGVPAPKLSLLNKDMHFTIYQMTSPIVVEAVQFLWARFKPSVTLWGVTDFSSSLSKDHDEIIEALEQRDGSRARQLMFAHVMHAWELRESNADLRAHGGRSAKNGLAEGRS